MARLRVGIAGYGIVGKRRHECLDKHPRFETVGVCDRNFASDTTLPSGIPAFKNYKSLLALPLDVLLVSMGKRTALGVLLDGGMLVGPGAGGLCSAPLSDALCAWRVG